MKKLLVLFSVFVLIFRSVYAQSEVNREKILTRRLDKIEFYHLGIGGDMAINKNYGFGPKIYFGVGSTRNLLNADLGLKLMFVNPWLDSRSEYVRWYTLPIFVSGSVNAIRWKRNSVYIGGEIDYNTALGSGHHRTNTASNPETQDIASNHFSWQGKLGFRSEYWDIALFYENDMAPALNQKYIYESSDYDYITLHASIFERWRIGVGVAYNFRF